MNAMRRLLIVLLAILFGASLIVAAFSVAANVVLRPEFIKQAIGESGLYDAVGYEIQQIAIGGRTVLDTDPLWQVVTNRFGPGSMRDMGEQFVDDLFAWLAGRTDIPPELRLASVMAELEDETGVLLPPDAQEIAAADMRIENEQVRRWYAWLRVAPFVGGAFAALALFGIALASRTRMEKVRNIALTLLLVGLLGKVLTATIFIILNISVGLTVDTLERSEVQHFAMPVRLALEVIPLQFASWALAVFGGVVLVSAVLYILIVIRRLRARRTASTTALAP